MNLYIRFFDNEVLVSNVNEAINFLRSLPDVEISPEMEADLREYAESDIMFPKRYKVRAHVYFIVIKTTAATMQDFKEKKALRSGGKQGNHMGENDNPIVRLNEQHPGWYEGEVNFKRVVLVPATGKHEYIDTKFVADCKANSAIDCYNRIVDYLRERVDHRSQFPSAKGKNFQYKYLGMWK